MTGPFGSLRDYLKAVDELGQVLHVDKVDQDAFEATGFMYALIDKVGWGEAPIVSFNQVKTGGRWIHLSAGLWVACYRHLVSALMGGGPRLAGPGLARVFQ